METTPPSTWKTEVVHCLCVFVCTGRHRRYIGITLSIYSSVHL